MKTLLVYSCSCLFLPPSHRSLWQFLNTLELLFLCRDCVSLFICLFQWKCVFDGWIGSCIKHCFVKFSFQCYSARLFMLPRWRTKSSSMLDDLELDKVFHSSFKCLWLCKWFSKVTFQWQLQASSWWIELFIGLRFRFVEDELKPDLARVADETYCSVVLRPLVFAYFKDGDKKEFNPLFIPLVDFSDFSQGPTISSSVGKVGWSDTTECKVRTIYMI